MSQGVKRSMIFKFLMLPLLIGCSPQDDGSENDEAFRGKVILFDFYDADVKLLVGGKVAYEGQLNVLPANESTGLSLAKEIEMAGCEEVVLTSNGETPSFEMICPDKSGFEIYINPNVDPKIRISYDPAFGLD